MVPHIQSALLPQAFIAWHLHFTIDYLLATNVLIVEMDDANGRKNKIVSDREHGYSPFLHHRSGSHHK
jgi:hypothetical protein